MMKTLLVSPAFSNCEGLMDVEFQIYGWLLLKRCFDVDKIVRNVQQQTLT